VRNPNTLFVIGAGAGAEVDMPTGKQLIDTIANRLERIQVDFTHSLRA
jgi:hypothetical protein